MWVIRIVNFLLVLIPLAAHAQTSYTVVDVGSLGGTSTTITGVNSAGTAVGIATNAAGRERAFIWKDGGMRIIKPPRGFTRSLATGISNTGKVVGFFDNQGSCDYPTCKASAFAFDRSAQILPTLGGSTSRAYAISDSDYIVGVGYSALNGGALRGFVHRRKFCLFLNGSLRCDAMFRKTKIIELGTLGGIFSEAFDVNIQGIVVGMATIPGPGHTHAAVFRGNTIEDLGTLGGHSSRALGINNAGEIVGYSDTTNNANFRAFLVKEGQMLDLGTLGGENSIAHAINNSSQIVGYSTTTNKGPRAFLYQNGTMIDLNDHIDDKRWNLSEARVISDTGIIGAVASIEGVDNKGVLLIPSSN